MRVCGGTKSVTLVLSSFVFLLIKSDRYVSLLLPGFSVVVFRCLSHYKFMHSKHHNAKQKLACEIYIYTHIHLHVFPRRQAISVLLNTCIAERAKPD